jgi:hypothetical protein
MQQRPPVEEIIRGLETTSAHIRALAHAGDDRPEISQPLGIRYQHVRKVLLGGGMTNGLRRQVRLAREPVVDAAPAPCEATSWAVLLPTGFRCVGEWPQDPESAIILDATAPVDPGVYAFVVDEVVVSIGLTNNSLRTRFDQYRRGHKGQRTNARVNTLIGKTLSEGQLVKVVVATPESLEWYGLPVHTAAGLEDELIQTLRPAWNITEAI